MSGKEKIEIVDLWIQLPKAMVERIDEIVKEKEHGFADRNELFREAVRKEIERFDLRAKIESYRKKK